MKAVVIGDVCIDHTIYGKVYGTAPEAPVPVVKVESETVTPGMAANVAQQLHQYMLDVKLLSILGNKSKYTHMKYDKVIRGKLLPTNIPPTVKQRTVVDGRVISRNDYEYVGCPPRYDDFLKMCENYLIKHKPDFIILSDYGKHTVHLPEDIIDMHSVVYVDPDKNKDVKRYKGAFCIKANEKEALAITGEKTVEKALEIMAHYCTLPVITLDEKGSIAKYRGVIYRQPAIQTTVVDVTGCGDSFLAAFAYWFERTFNVETALKQASVAAAQTVGRLGC